MSNISKTAAGMLVACMATLGVMAQYNSKNLFLENEQNAKAFVYKNLVLYPVHARETFAQAHRQIGKYTSLTDALAQNKVKISEKEGGESVNNLSIQNNSNDTVIILGGEVIKGGKQDRMVAQDMIIPPKSKKSNLDVYCVEHGRWTYHDRAGSSNTSVGDNATYMFNASSPVSGTEVRKAAAVSKSQTEVWNKVQEVTVKNNAESSTGTYTAMEKSANFVKQLSAYKAYFTTLLKGNKDVIGFVAVTGDKILGCDLFATRDLFEQQMSGLVSSYSTEAISSGAAPTVSYTKVKGYIDDLLADEKEQDKKIEKKGNSLKVKDSKLHIAVY